MKQKILKWTLRLTVLIILLFGVLILTVLNPTLLYANKTVLENFTVYHNKPLDKDLKTRLDDARNIIKENQLFDSSLKFDICLNDGSLYPSLLEIFMGQAFALGFTSNKVAICGEANFKGNYVEVNGYKWNLTQLLAHEETHCLVYNKIGFWKSNPIANNPKWKWEGYPEYVSRRYQDQLNLVKNIKQLDEALELDKTQWGISFADSTVTSREYFNYRLLTQYCLDIKKMTFEEFLNDTTSEQTIKTQMRKWYSTRK
jgi:hypothetical protein